MQSSISKYRITKRVGGGSFGDIYLGVGANGEKVRRDTTLRGRVSAAAATRGRASPWGASTLASKGERATPHFPVENA